jgi:hypothetical protein
VRPNLAIRLVEAGRRTDALTTAQEAADHYRQLVALNRDAYLPNLAASVNNLAIRLARPAITPKPSQPPRRRLGSTGKPVRSTDRSTTTTSQIWNDSLLA